MNVGSNSISLQSRLSRFAAKAMFEANQLEPGTERDALFRKILEANNAIKIEKWLSSPGPRSPI